LSFSFTSPSWLIEERAARWRSFRPTGVLEPGRKCVEKTVPVRDCSEIVNA